MKDGVSRKTSQVARSKGILCVKKFSLADGYVSDHQTSQSFQGQSYLFGHTATISF